MTNQPANLIAAARQEGLLTAASMEALEVVDIGARIQDALGVSADDVESSEVVLVTMLIDDSGSIDHAGNAKAVRDGHNAVLDALAASTQQSAVLVHTRYLNGTVLFPYAPLSQVERMTTTNYHPIHGTPLYDETLAMLGAVLAKSQQFAENGVPVRTVSLIVTDGDDQHSRRGTAAKVKTVVKDMLRQENHTIAAMGVDDGQTDFRLIFRGMGVKPDWILTPAGTPSEIRRAFQVFSQSAASLGRGGSLSTNGLGGFVAP